MDDAPDTVATRVLVRIQPVGPDERGFGCPRPFHVAEDEINHRGQIRWLRARLP